MRKRFAQARGRAAEAERFAPPPRLQSERQREILALAARLFRERGYHATTMADIGTAAGISGPAIYRHFAGKDELLHVAVWTLARRNAEAVRLVRSAAPPEPEAQLRALVHAFVKTVVEERDIACVYLFETRHATENMVAQFREIEWKWQQEWLNALLAVRPELDEATAHTLVRAAVFLAGSATLESPVLEAAALIDTLEKATVAMMLGDRTGGSRP